MSDPVQIDFTVATNATWDVEFAWARAGVAAVHAPATRTTSRPTRSRSLYESAVAARGVSAVTASEYVAGLVKTMLKAPSVQPASTADDTAAGPVSAPAAMPVLVRVDDVVVTPVRGHAAFCPSVPVGASAREGNALYPKPAAVMVIAVTALAAIV